jgi:ATP-dependent DNA helicase RecQ
MLSPLEILKKHWGYTQFRPLQAEIIETVLSGKDTLALLPTGGGKSICFQVPGLAVDGVCIVISPLIALMKDQVYQLNKRDIAAKAVFSGMPFSEIDKTLDEAAAGNLKFLYVSPERIRTKLFLERLKRMKVGLLAIDEAHCISKWGHDFRPAYMQIKEIKQYIPKVPTIALTATATNLVRKEIIEQLEIKNCEVFVQSFARKNLCYSVIESDYKEKKIAQILHRIQGSAIVYSKTRKQTVEITKSLAKLGVKADFYHAGLSVKERNTKQDAWIKNQTRVIVSTNAFGMGIDKPDVRVVIHTDLPENMEAYYQESGRAGRDNEKAYAVSLFNPNDLENLEKNLQLKYPEISFIKKVYQSLCNYLKLAWGAEIWESFDFDIHDFASTFGLNPRDTHYALKILENQNIIFLNDAYFNPSKVKIIASSKEFYGFQLRNPNYEPFTKTLLRIYGGEIFTNYLIISEIEIGNLTFSSFDEIVKTLTFMHNQKLIDYVPQKSKPQLGFLSARQDAENLSIDYRELEIRKRNDKKALRAISQYTLNTSKCRMLMIQDYFDEITSQVCGICDNCLKLKKAGLSGDISEKYALHIKTMMPVSMNKLEVDPFFEDKELLIKILRYKIDNQVWGVDDYGLIYEKN